MNKEEVTMNNQNKEKTIAYTTYTNGHRSIQNYRYNRNGANRTNEET